MRSVKSVVLGGGSTVVLLCWGYIPGLLLVLLPPPLSQKTWLYLACVHLFLKGVQMLQWSAQYNNTNLFRTQLELVTHSMMFSSRK